jgi:hypothetical protein
MMMLITQIKDMRIRLKSTIQRLLGFRSAAARPNRMLPTPNSFASIVDRGSRLISKPTAAPVGHRRHDCRGKRPSHAVTDMSDGRRGFDRQR